MNLPSARAAGLALLLISAPTRAPAAPAEEEIRITLSRWYEDLAKEEKGRLWNLVVPGLIEATPTYRYIDTGARKLGPRVYTSLAAKALKFAWEIDSIRRDSSFAKVQVWERGYFYAWAAQRTYERAAATTFVLERREPDGPWLIAAHRSIAQGIPPNKVTAPMPDLRAFFYATDGEDRDPAADARAAARN